MPTKKPDKKTQPAAYKAWVRGKLRHWDPADDRGTPDAYAPRRDGILWEPCKKRDRSFEALEKAASEKYAKDNSTPASLQR